MVLLDAASKVALPVTPESLALHFLFNLLFTFLVIHFLYYRKSRRTDYYFTFLLLSASIFLIIYLLSTIKLKMGFALGLFAVFGIMRYRTVSIPVREMTYLFILVALSCINALGTTLGWAVLLTANGLLLVLTLLCELLFAHRRGVKYLKYDRIELCRPSRREELIRDLEERFELKVLEVHVGSINCLRDMALLKVYYEPLPGENIDDEINRIPNE